MWRNPPDFIFLKAVSGGSSLYSFIRLLAATPVATCYAIGNEQEHNIWQGVRVVQSHSVLTYWHVLIYTEVEMCPVIK